MQVGLDMRFGAPRMEVREPRNLTDASPRIRAHFARRGVSLRGTHWLDMEPGCWRLELADGTRVRDSSPVRQLDRAVAKLEGEKLEGLIVDVRTGASVLYFDLGARIVIRRRRADAERQELWSLNNSVRVVEVYSDGSYRIGSVRRTLDPHASLVANHEHTLIMTRTAKLARRIRTELRAGAV